MTNREPMQGRQREERWEGILSRTVSRYDRSRTTAEGRRPQPDHDGSDRTEGVRK